ncbi:hypothetical protein HZC31_02910 [Candidatus Woesearchaeota archaeon]|nr:hypothetical protein [Candidatus Woesearchaeota archaeon]
MQFDDNDLEAILQAALAKAPEHGLDPNKLEVVYRAALKELSERKANDVVELYRSLQPSGWYVNSFQMAIKTRGDQSLLPQQTKEEGQADYITVRKMVNFRFGTTLDRDKRGRGEVYLWLVKSGNVSRGPNMGYLHGYGNAHLDAVMRENMHYFVVVADYAKLSQVVDSFLMNPKNMSIFNQHVFDWKNDQPKHMNGGEPNLFSHIKDLYVHTPELGHRNVSLK